MDTLLEVEKDFNSFVSLCLEILTDLDKIKVSIVSKYKDSYEVITVANLIDD